MLWPTEGQIQQCTCWYRGPQMRSTLRYDQQSPIAYNYTCAFDPQRANDNKYICIWTTEFHRQPIHGYLTQPWPPYTIHTYIHTNTDVHAYTHIHIHTHTHTPHSHGIPTPAQPCMGVQHELDDGNRRLMNLNYQVSVWQMGDCVYYRTTHAQS